MWVKFSLAGCLANVWAHDEQPVNGLPQKSHVVVSRNVLKHRDLLREALEREGKWKVSGKHKSLHFLFFKMTDRHTGRQTISHIYLRVQTLVEKVRS